MPYLFFSAFYLFSFFSCLLFAFYFFIISPYLIPPSLFIHPFSFLFASRWSTLWLRHTPSMDWLRENVCQAFAYLGKFWKQFIVVATSFHYFVRCIYHYFNIAFLHRCYYYLLFLLHLYCLFLLYFLHRFFLIFLFISDIIINLWTIMSLLMYVCYAIRN